MSLTHEVADGLWTLAVLPPLRLQRGLQADTFLLQAQLAALQQTAFVLQLAHVGLQLLQLFTALRLGFAEPRSRLGLGPQQRVGFFQLMEMTTVVITKAFASTLHLDGFYFDWVQQTDSNTWHCAVDESCKTTWSLTNYLKKKKTDCTAYTSYYTQLHTTHF